jgi:HEAT repeat protein
MMPGMVFDDRAGDGDRREFCPSLRPGRRLQVIWLVVTVAAILVAGGRAAHAQLDYVARFTFEKPAYRVGEPVFCTFTIRNTGTRPFAFSYRSPWRALGSNPPKEPRFRVTDAKGRRLPDPSPKPCGGAKEGVVYGFVSLPPGGIHRERWLLNQWARLTEPGRYFVRAERRLPLLGFDPVTEGLAKKPLAFALAINELSFVLKPATEDELRPLLEPYLKAFDDPAGGTGDLSESVLVATALPKPYFLDSLVRLARPIPEEHRWDPRRGLEGLARLGTAPAWAAILETARGDKTKGTADDPALRGYAILLLGEKGDPRFVAPLVSMLPSAPEEIRGDILRALGFFHSPRANQSLFERLHSSEPRDRVNAILGLRNLETKDAVPALIAMLTDPEPAVRQVANFALRSLTGAGITLSASAGKADARRASAQWHAWWRAHNSTFTPPRAPPCHDW